MEVPGMMIRRGRAPVTLAVSLSIAVAGMAATPGVARAQLPSPSELRQQFAETDGNRDGKIDREEFHRRTVELFYFLDKDRKGYLVLVDIRGLSSEDFKAANRKGDGKLTLDEFANARFRIFDQVDSNGDGVLTLQEIEVYVNRQRAQP
jgi:Ca2+-binding EF-hand superfamily protein